MKFRTSYTFSKGHISSYSFGFNGQLKDNEVYGEGNAYTAEFWEYDPRIGRRWNIDPVVKPWRSPYDAFSNSPLVMIDPEGDDDYYDKQGKYLGSDFAETKNVRIIEKETWNTFTYYMGVIDNKSAIADEKIHEGFTFLAQKSSKVLTIEYNASDYENLWNQSSSTNKENGGYFVLDPAEATLSYRPWSNNGSNSATQSSSDAVVKRNGASYIPQTGLVVVGSIHTHPTQDAQVQANIGGMTRFGPVSDAASYEFQYTQDQVDANGNPMIGDGLQAIAHDFPYFTMAGKSIDLFSQNGKNTKNNNIASSKDLKGGAFNILKISLEVNGGKDKR